MSLSDATARELGPFSDGAHRWAVDAHTDVQLMGLVVVGFEHKNHGYDVVLPLSTASMGALAWHLWPDQKGNIEDTGALLKHLEGHISHHSLRSSQFSDVVRDGGSVVEILNLRIDATPGEDSSVSHLTSLSPQLNEVAQACWQVLTKVLGNVDLCPPFQHKVSREGIDGSNYWPGVDAQHVSQASGVLLQHALGHQAQSLRNVIDGVALHPNVDRPRRARL